MKKLTLCMFVGILFLSINVKASLRKIVAEAVQSNQILKINKLEVKSSELEAEKLSAVNGWSLEGDLAHQDRFRDAILSFQSLRTISQSLNVALQKKFSWGGTFRVEQGLVNYNLTKWGGSGLTFAGPNFETRPVEYVSRLSFSQDLGKDFLGRSQDLDYQSIAADIKLKQKEVLSQEEGLLGQLVTFYTQAGYYKSLINVTEGNIKRYKRRKKLVAKRVRDGLRLEVDSLQVDSASLALENQLVNLEEQLATITEKISLVLERNYLDKEATPMGQNLRGNHPRWESWELKGNLELEKAQAQLFQIDLLIKKAKRDFIPSITLNASWGTNAIEPSLGDAFSDGNITSRFQEKTIGVNVVIPLGRKLAKAKMEQNRVRKLQQETRINIMKKGMGIQFSSLKKRIKLLAKKLKTQKKQLKLLEKVRSRYDKLYSQGRVEVDIILSAEDSYSEAQAQLYQSLLSYELLFWEMSVLTGHIPEYFEYYKESV